MKGKIRITPLPPGLRQSSWEVRLATLGGTGRLRPAPGTWGSLAAALVGYALILFGGPWALVIGLAVLTPLAVMTAGRFAHRTGTKDDPSIVVDEAVGLWVAALPAGNHVVLWVVAFFLFRLFDIWKPWPVSWADRKIGGGWGIVADDILAGIYASFGVAFGALFYL